jgi:hypothetical protein
MSFPRDNEEELYLPLSRGEKRFSVIGNQVNHQIVPHIVGPAANNVLVHVSDLTSDIFGKGVAHTRKEPVLIEPLPGNPIGVVKTHKRLVLDNVTEAGCKFQWDGRFEQVPITKTHIRRVVGISIPWVG